MRIRRVLLTCIVLPLYATSAIASGKSETRKTAARPADPAPAAAKRIDPTIVATARAGIRRLIDEIDIPYESFSLPNGLRVLVVTDRSVPTVNVSIWYDVGSKHEQKGRSGFAHLFEHLMFNGSENVPGDYLLPLMTIGADVNGSTSSDRTNYYATVPTPALERALFMESDRMGHFTGALTQAVLDEQRGVVQNEKRQGDERATSIADYKAQRAIYPADHPYGHKTIGSMKDLNAADLEDVRAFFKSHYGPNNAMLILAGDVDLATAKTLVTRYFGAIPAGPRTLKPVARPVTLPRTISETVTAPVTTPVIIRQWSVAGADDLDSVTLDLVVDMLQLDQGNGLIRRLVRDRKLFERIDFSNSTAGEVGDFSIEGVVRPGVDATAAAAALDDEFARFLNGTPSSDLITQATAQHVFRLAKQLEFAPQRGAMLGSTAMASGDPDHYKAEVRHYAAQTPKSVMRAARRWLTRPTYELTVLPGPRVTPEEDAGMDGSAVANVPAAHVPAPAPASTPAVAAGKGTAGARGSLPSVGPSPAARFPEIEHATLTNGIRVSYAPVEGTSYTTASLRIEGGYLNEPVEQTGVTSMMYALLGDAYGGHDEDWIAARRSLLDLTLTASAGSKAGRVALDVPDANLEAGLVQLRQMLSSPTFSQVTLDRLKREKLDRLSRGSLSPGALMTEVFVPLIDAGSPYKRFEMADDPRAVGRIDRRDIVASFHRLIRPDRTRIQLVSSKPLAELLPLLEKTIGTWKVEEPAVPLPEVATGSRPGKPQIVLVDLPDAVQAMVQGGQTVDLDPTDPSEAVDLASAILGEGFTSRMNMNLREDKHWTYGAGSFFNPKRYASTYIFRATIQQDKVGQAIAEVVREVQGITRDRPITAEEFDAMKTAALGRSASRFAGRQAIAMALDDIAAYDRSDDYPGRSSERLRAVTRSDATDALRKHLDTARWVWVVVGNARIVQPQLASLGLPLTVIKARDVLPPHPRPNPDG